MSLIKREYQCEDDFWRIRVFLREVFLQNGRRMFSWPVARWDYWRWHGIMNLHDGTLEQGVFLWETKEGQVASVLNREAPGWAFLQISPAHKTAALEEEMIAHAEEHLRTESRRGGQVLWVWVDAHDGQRQAILKKRGYVHIADADEHQWQRTLDTPLPETSTREGYTLRPLGDASELPARSWASWRSFHPDESDSKYDNDWTWYQNIQHAPLYRRDLDLVAIAPTGEIAAFTTIWLDDVTRTGYFEPVGTVPEHQRRGLARSLLCEGMRRLKERGADRVMVIGGEPPANALYEATVGPEHEISMPWEKRWK